MKKNVLAKGLFVALLLASAVATAEENYPAADFQPTVVYSEGSTSSNEKSTASSEKAESSKEVAKVETAEPSNNNMLFGLVILAAVGGFFVLNKPKKCDGKKSTCSSSSHSNYSDTSASSLTGVEKYLQSHNMSAATGVEKYLAQKEVADKEASLTGVDKYLRNRG